MRKEHLAELCNLDNQLRSIAQTPGVFNMPANAIYATIRKDIPEGLHIEEYPTQTQILSIAKTGLFLRDSANHLLLNPIALGQIIACLDAILIEESKPSSWNCVHPRIQRSSRKLYTDGHFSNASEDAFIEINDAVKELYREAHPGEEPPDGVDLMHKAFQEKGSILLADTNTETGRNIQQGFHFMFAGAISAFRNPKAHSNQEVLTAKEAMRRIMFASELMYGLDRAGK